MRARVAGTIGKTDGTPIAAGLGRRGRVRGRRESPSCPTRSDRRAEAATRRSPGLDGLRSCSAGALHTPPPGRRPVAPDAAGRSREPSRPASGSEPDWACGFGLCPSPHSRCAGWRPRTPRPSARDSARPQRGVPPRCEIAMRSAEGLGERGDCAAARRERRATRGRARVPREATPRGREPTGARASGRPR